MKALLLAGGYGTRLLPITKNIPKCLVDFNGEKLLDIWLSRLVESGVREILINTHHLAEVVNQHIDRSIYKNNVRLVYEDELLGTAGTIKKNQVFFGDDPLIVIHADNLSIFSMDEFKKCFMERPSGIHMTMMTFNTDCPESCGIVELSKKGTVEKFYEKILNPPGNLANGAIYIIDVDVLNFIYEIDGDFIDFSTKIIPSFIGKINTFHNKIYHRDIGTPQSLNTARIDYASMIKN
jgi:mannose-1-phosphate guanylyltransferase